MRVLRLLTSHTCLEPTFRNGKVPFLTLLPFPAPSLGNSMQEDMSPVVGVGWQWRPCRSVVAIAHEVQLPVMVRKVGGPLTG